MQALLSFSNANLRDIIAVGVAIFELIILWMSVSVNIIQLTSQGTSVEICALTTLFFRAHDEAVAEVFRNLCNNHVPFKITPGYIV